MAKILAVKLRRRRSNYSASRLSLPTPQRLSILHEDSDAVNHLKTILKMPSKLIEGDQARRVHYVLRKPINMRIGRAGSASNKHFSNC